MQQLDINFDADNTQPAKAMEQQDQFNTQPVPQPGMDRNAIDPAFRILFDELQHNFITRSRKDIAIELKKIENRTALLQDKINSLHTEVDRLSAIDLDTEFKKMQGNIAYIAQGVQAINNSLGQSISGIGANMDGGLSATNEAVRKYAEYSAKQLVKLDEETKSNILFLEHKIQALSNQQKKNARTNNMITLLGILLLLGGIIYIICYQAGVRIQPIW